MGETPNGRILDDDGFVDASEEERRASYSLVLDRIKILRPEREPVSVDERIRSFARFAGCKPRDITYIPAIPAAEASGWWPLSDEERSALFLAEEDWQGFLARQQA